jgi:hypothetical protein
VTFANGAALWTGADHAPDFTADATGQIGLHDGALNLTGAIRPARAKARRCRSPCAARWRSPAARPLIAAN